MIKGLLVCAVSLVVAMPAMAGDRPGAKTPAPRAVALNEATSMALPNRDLAPGTRAPIRFSLPPEDSTHLRSIRSDLSISVPVKSMRRFDLGETGTNAPSESLRLTEGTADDGGRYAVRDTLSDYRKPRFRRSALGTMLVLRIDGQEESPAFSVGGGGVAAAVWRAVPKS